MARVDVTEADLLAALREASSPDAEPDDAYTVVELADRTGTPLRVMRERVGAMVRRGQVECVRVTRTAMDGRAAKVPAYRLTGRAA